MAIYVPIEVNNEIEPTPSIPLTEEFYNIAWNQNYESVEYQYNFKIDNLLFFANAWNKKLESDEKEYAFPDFKVKSIKIEQDGPGPVFEYEITCLGFLQGDVYLSKRLRGSFTGNDLKTIFGFSWDSGFENRLAFRGGMAEIYPYPYVDYRLITEIDEETGEEYSYISEGENFTSKGVKDPVAALKGYYNNGEPVKMFDIFDYIDRIEVPLTLSGYSIRNGGQTEQVQIIDKDYVSYLSQYGTYQKTPGYIKLVSPNMGKMITASADKHFSIVWKTPMDVNIDPFLCDEYYFSSRPVDQETHFIYSNLLNAFTYIFGNTEEPITFTEKFKLSGMGSSSYRYFWYGLDETLQYYSDYSEHSKTYTNSDLLKYSCLVVNDWYIDNGSGNLFNIGCGSWDRNQAITFEYWASFNIKGRNIPVEFKLGGEYAN